MGKYADRYFKVHPWKIVEDGFAPAYGEVAESVFSLGNEYTGLRGYFDEGYSGVRLQGSYLNGIYERRLLPKSVYKGMLPFTEFMVNTVDWVYTRIFCGGQALDLAKSQFTGFHRELDLRTGVLTRRFVWEIDSENAAEICFERFTSMEQEKLVGQKIIFKAVRGRPTLRVRVGLDFTCPHVSADSALFSPLQQSTGANRAEILAETHVSKQQVWASAAFRGLENETDVSSDGIAALETVFSLDSEHEKRIERVVCLLTAKTEEQKASLKAHCADAQKILDQADYETLKQQSANWWQRQWQVSDIEIHGDDENQQGIRFCIFQLHQTLHTAKYGAVFGAKGLTGEAYNGNTFWDSEVCCLPFYLFNNPEAAKSFLKFRYDTLPEAMERAQALDCKGAFYPIATISGRECCDLWQHASLQLQASTGVAYGLWNYVNQTDDKAFLYDYGAKMLVEICRMLASRGDWDLVTGQYGYYCVMGPDEFQMMVHHNAYTNFMGKKTFLFTLKTLAEMTATEPKKFAVLEVTNEELADWQSKADKMYLPYDEKTGLFEQHMGYFHLPHVEINAIPAEQFPLYSHWSYERIYRNDMVKQPDVLMFFLLYGSDFTKEQLKANFDFYEPRCIHESSLSPAIHSILACRLGRLDKAEQLFDFATRMDLDNYNRNTREGLHTTSIAGAWMNIVCGFGGLHTETATLTLAPIIPNGWEGYSFRVCTGGSIVRAEITRKKVTLAVQQGDNVSAVLYGKKILITENPTAYDIEAAQ
jgi:maltose phosphorylase